ncbi:MAG: hypothetical protein KA175_06965 [Flavobacteriales bacterium]|nr:hypothetical protein [Flavobacteriales bacterium]
MHIAASGHGQVNGVDEPGTMAAIAAQVHHLFHDDPFPDRTGLIVVSSNAGVRPALQFWSRALEQGLAFASPELFPWTLANAPCGWLARHFRITGPNFTFMGNAAALAAAMDEAADLLIPGRMHDVVVIALDSGDAAQAPTTFAGIRLTNEATGPALRHARDGTTTGQPEGSSSALLGAIITSLQAGIEHRVVLDESVLDLVLGIGTSTR